MFTRMKILFFTLGMIFIPINVVASNKVAYLYNLYKNKRTSQLCRVIHAGDFMYNSKLIPLIIYEELRKKPQTDSSTPSERPAYNPFENIIIVTEKNFFSMMEQCDTNSLSK